MTICPLGLQRIKRHITVDAPVELCYEAWSDSAKMPKFMRRVIQVEQKPLPANPVSDPEKIMASVPMLDQNNIPYSTIKHWLLSGPGGQLYEIENTVVLEIPNHFYCTTSTDPNDISVQSSVFFCPDGKNHSTLLEWEISFWPGHDIGPMTQLACEIKETGDNFMEQSLQDFKAYIETQKMVKEKIY